MLKVFSALLLCSSAAHGNTVVRVRDGHLVNADGSVGALVGVHTSQLQAAVVDALIGDVPAVQIRNTSVFNASNLRYLHLQGAYLADIPLLLPSMLVLKLDDGASIRAAANLSDPRNATRHAGLVHLVGAKYSAIEGPGAINASTNAGNGSAVPPRGGQYGFQAVHVEDSFHCSVRGVRLSADSGSGAIHVTGGLAVEVAGCDIGGGMVWAGGRRDAGRCVWVIATSRALVHDNHVHHCEKHALDFDAFTSASAAWGNLCEDNAEEGIFVEETASANFVFNNTCRRNGNGIGVYANAVGPVEGNIFAANVLEANTGMGMSSGGYGHAPNKYAGNNVFVANTARGNGRGGFNIAHGATVKEYWVNNDNSDGFVGTVPHSSANVSVFEP